MSSSEKKKLSCSNCRKIKRKCDGGHPCSSCAKRNAPCDYNTTDRRSQRYSVGYIKSLETNNDVLEGALAELVALRDEPEELLAKLESLSTSFPKKVEKPEGSPEEVDIEEEFVVVKSDEGSERPYVTEKDQFFGAGSVYGGRAPTQEQEPLLATKSDTNGQENGVITIERDFDYVAGLVRSFFDNQFYGTHHTLFDRNRILTELENRNFSGPFLNKELVYAICANCEQLSYAEADAYCDYVLKDLFSKSLASSIAVSQCYTLLALHCASKGQISKAWLFAGIGIRVGLDVGFDMCHGENPCPVSNRCYMGSIIIDQYLAMSLGRRSTLSLNNISVLRLDGESDSDYLTMKYAVEFIEMTRHMIRSTYQPVTFDKDPKVNYLLKFNRSKIFNMKLLKWKQNLDPVCSWSYTSLKNSKNMANENHTLKFLYYYMLIFLNKPFLHVPKQHSTVYVIEEMAKEVYLIINSKLQRINERTGLNVFSHESSESGILTSNTKFCSASMDICVVMLLTNVLMALMTSQPEHYIHLEKHFKTFAHYINYINLRKYDAAEKPMAVLLRKFEEFKAKSRVEGANSDESSSDNEHTMSKGEEASDVTSRSTPPSSDYSSSDHHNPVVENMRGFQSAPISGEVWNASRPPTEMQPNLQAATVVTAGQGEGSFAFDPWWQHVGEASRPQNFSTGVEQDRDVTFNGNAQFSTIPLPPQPDFQQEQFYVQYQPSVVPNSSSFAQYQPAVNSGTADQFASAIPAYDQQSVYSYDHLPKSKDPLDQVFNQLFSNTGEEFSTERDRLNWNEMFTRQYSEGPRWS
ncbi:hypothetical protein OXX59_003637 [Metschnikowia pulcherrima]